MGVIGGSLLGAVVVAVTVLAGAEPSEAQFGTFAWNPDPFCDEVRLNIDQAGLDFALTGSDGEQSCPNPGPLRFPAYGAMTSNPDGTLTLGFDIAFPGATLHIVAVISPADGNGVWISDDPGVGGGTFVFLGQVAAGASREGGRSGPRLRDAIPRR